MAEIPTALRKGTIVGKNAWTLIIWTPELAETFRQPVNPATGKPWQAIRDRQRFEGRLANLRALRAFEMALRPN